MSVQMDIMPIQIHGNVILIAYPHYTLITQHIDVLIIV